MPLTFARVVSFVCNPRHMPSKYYLIRMTPKLIIRLLSFADIFCFSSDRTDVWRPREPCGASPSVDEGQREQNPLSRAAGKKWGFQKPAGRSSHCSVCVFIRVFEHTLTDQISYIQRGPVHYFWPGFVQIYLHVVSASCHLASFTVWVMRCLSSV